MFFEGSEKKIELQVNCSAVSLRSLPLNFWQQTLSLAGAEILSQLSNQACDAYVLSESSLLVWERKLLLITCGNTRLIDAVNHVIEQIGTEVISSLSYQRKSEFLSHLQASRFEDDVARLRAQLPGTAYRVGHLDNHHHYLFCSEQFVQSDASTCLLMYHIKGELAEYLRCNNQSSDEIRKRLQLERLLPEFDFDDYLFEPCGYSVNGIFEDKFLTIHITPQEHSSYVSIETNLNFLQYSFNIFAELLKILNPSSWDIIGMNMQVNNNDFPCHRRIANCDLQLNPLNEFNYNHYTQADSETLFAEVL
ncbi:S-adenosylmethionine decarboxylase proenzyme [Shewanella schlegeliana]|uniref:Adenosylmethionine decarboxylase n=1 Tax=Shewanella schlegeliana TaxID=190308 RepID=A0ABS1STP6_9GAMM|nr:adenosylmethionine decarboxylase [Shewanella schlegeliana]MBL4911907.1 adenosylmethionine decarboxylase [Shewanella schlegeliana]MCL1110140.1 S-adenosylmethionine decarboxylase proenzyme [Shewanella schlegeliana]GIU26931.1 S-adenosylmethionine decarboxylase SpeD [Shewanella schlegeliana]